MSTVKGLRAGGLAHVLIGLTPVSRSAQRTDRQAALHHRAAGVGPHLSQGREHQPGHDHPDHQHQQQLAYVQCFYINGRSIGGVPVWQVTDFESVLTRQQPTHWAVVARPRGLPAGRSTCVQTRVSIRVGAAGAAGIHRRAGLRRDRRRRPPGRAPTA